MSRIAIDIDGTVLTEEMEVNRGKAVPITGAIESINYLYEAGHTIIIYTARTYRELETTVEQLNKYNLKYHHLVVGKPVADVFVDDRAVAMTGWIDTLENIEQKLKRHFLKKVNVLVSASGSTNGINVIKALQKQQEYLVKIIAVDSNPNAAGLFLADNGIVIPEVEGHSYSKALSKVCEKYNINIAIPTHGSELPYYSANKEMFESMGVKIMVSPLIQLRICNDKKKMSKYFNQIGVRHPLEYLLADVKIPLFIKSRFGSGSTFAKVIECKEQLYYHYNNTPSPFLQEYIEGTEYTVSLLSDYAGKVVGAVPVKRVRVRNGLSVEAQVELDPVMVTECTKVVEQLGLIGVSNVQVIKRNSDMVFIEVNPRFASGTLPLVVNSGLDIPLLMLKIMLGDPIGSITIRDKLKMTRYYDYVVREGN